MNLYKIYDVVQDRHWDEEKIRIILPDDLATHILENLKPLMLADILDKPVWMLEIRGYFSIKSAWKYLWRREEPYNAYRKIWVKGLPFKIAFFMWKLWKNKLLLEDFFRRLGYLMVSKYWCCDEPHEEIMKHLFFTSKAAKTMWRYFLGHAGIAIDGITFHKAIIKCWTVDAVPRLQPIVQALPSVIVW